MKRTRLRHPLIAHDAAWKFGKLGVELGNITVGPARYLAKGAHAQIVKHAFKDRSDTDDELEIVRLRSAKQDRRGSIVFDVHHQLAIPRRFAECIVQGRSEFSMLATQCLELDRCWITVGELIAQAPCFRFKTANDARFLSPHAVVGIGSDRSGRDLRPDR